MIWNDIAPIYDSLYKTSYAQCEDRLVASVLKSCNGDVLDLACGTGLAYSMMSNLNSYTGVDISAKMIDIALAKNLPNAKFAVMPIDSYLAMQDTTYDHIVGINGSLSYCDNPAKALQDCYGRLRKGGTVTFGVLHKGSLWRHVKRDKSFTLRNADVKEQSSPHFFTQDDMKALINHSGFAVNYCRTYAAFGNLLEWGVLWSLDNILAKHFHFGHALLVQGIKA